MNGKPLNSSWGFKEFLLTFSAPDDGGNDVEFDMILGVIGAKKAKLECEEADLNQIPE